MCPRQFLLHEFCSDRCYCNSNRSALASEPVQVEEFVYPRYEIPLLEAYGGQFESAFIVLHPFIRVPEAMAWNSTQKYPTDKQILAHATKCPWTEVSRRTVISTYARMNQALLTSIGSLDNYLADFAGSLAIAQFVKTNPVWMPTEGRLEPLLQRDFLEVFAAAGAEELIFVPEFPNSDPIARLRVSDLKSGSVPFPSRGTLLATDRSFLFTVDWDSFFTLFYGPRAFVTESVWRLGVEGFFATANTDHAWFNYSFGCAIITASPEDCRQV
jgi:hypothetical protein